MTSSHCPNCERELVPDPEFDGYGLRRCVHCKLVLRRDDAGPRPTPVAGATGLFGVSTELSAGAAPLIAPVPDATLAIELRVRSGPDRGRVFRAAGSEIFLGRRTGDIPVADDKVSRQHLVLKSTERGCLVRDLGSSNGTFLNGLRVAEAVLSLGQELTVGDTVLEVVKLDGPGTARRS